ncbi:MAG: hypothetical protein R3A10_06030 [Caldilineaceae bacterium]
MAQFIIRPKVSTSVMRILASRQAGFGQNARGDLQDERHHHVGGDVRRISVRMMWPMEWPNSLKVDVVAVAQ